MTIPRELEEIIVIDQEILHGTPCFRGTRVPIGTFIDHVESGVSLDDFLEGYPSVKREQAILVLEWFSQESRKSIGLDLAS